MSSNSTAQKDTESFKDLVFAAKEISCMLYNRVSKIEPDDSGSLLHICNSDLFAEFQFQVYNFLTFLKKSENNIDAEVYHFMGGGRHFLPFIVLFQDIKRNYQKNITAETLQDFKSCINQLYSKICSDCESLEELVGQK